MSDLEQLRRLADRVTPPPYEAITAAARRRDRRSAVTTTMVALTTVCLVTVGVLVVREMDSSVPEPVRPPVTSPTPAPSEKSKPSRRAEPQSLESMTPEEVVTAADAELRGGRGGPRRPRRQDLGVARPVPLVPGQAGRTRRLPGPPTYTGMALTTDGYETATYARHSFSSLLSAVHSPRDDVFLVTDLGNGREWLVDLDGTVRRVERVETEIRPSDPRLWFECARAGGWVTTWCSLDVDAATTYVWPEEWNRSAVSPNSGEEPWGWSPASEGTYEDPGVVVEAWWYENGVRHRRVLATDARGDVVHGSPAGDLAYWTWQVGDSTVDLLTSQDRGATWDGETRAAPAFKRWVRMTRSPDGALLAWMVYPHLVVWRAEASGGGFHKVLEVHGLELAGGGLWTQDGLVYANGSGTAALSEDGGLTWSFIETWR